MSRTSARHESFPLFISAGQYDLHIAAPGFAPYDSAGIRVHVNRTISFPVTLAIGTSTSQLSVTAKAATVDVSSTLGNVVSSRKRQISR